MVVYTHMSHSMELAIWIPLATPSQQRVRVGGGKARGRVHFCTYLMGNALLITSRSFHKSYILSHIRTPIILISEVLYKQLTLDQINFNTHQTGKDLDILYTFSFWHAYVPVSCGQITKGACPNYFWKN